MKIPDNPLSPKIPQKTPDEKLHEVSEMYEKHFLGEMLKAMRSTVHEGGFIQTNQAEKIFREQLDQEYVDKWGAQGGIGLANLIYQQMVDKYGAQMGIKKPVEKPHGPLPVTANNSFTAKAFHRSGAADGLSLRFDRSDTPQTPNAKPEEISNPWSGVLLGKRSLATGEQLLEVQHDNGLKSQLVFQGTTSRLTPGQELQAGETLGLLSPATKTFYWHTQTGPQPEKSVSE